MTESRKEGLSAWALFLASLTLYLLTLAPSVVTLFDDSLEFQLVTYQLGIAHPTGYPLYTMLGKLFTLLPIGNVAFRVNLMSAVFGAATVTLLYHLIRPLGHAASSARLGAIAGASALALSPIFWQQATIAEVYTLNACFMALILLAALQPVFRHRHHNQDLPRQSLPKSVSTGSTYDYPMPCVTPPNLPLLAFLCGLALTHHRTIILLLPPLAAYLLWQTHAIRNTHYAPRTTFPILLAGLAPLLLYLYLPLRGHVGSLDGTYQNSWAGFWQQVLASGYGSAFLLDNPFSQARGIRFFGQLIEAQFGWLTVMGVVGWGVLIGQRRLAVSGLTTAIFLMVAVFNYFYNVADIEVFCIPMFLIWAIWLGVGMQFVATSLTQVRLGQTLRWLNGSLLGSTSSPDRFRLNGSPPGSTSSPDRVRQLLGRAGWLLLMGLLLAQLGYTAAANWPALSQRNSWRVHDYGLDMLHQPLPQQATIIGILGEMTLIRYFQQTEAMRPDVQTVVADDEADRLQAIHERLAAGQTVFLTRQLSGLAERYSLSAVGPLIQVQPQPRFDQPAMPFPLDQTVTPAIRLIGYDISYPPDTAGIPGPIRLTVAWQATAAMTPSLKLSARLLDGTDQPIAMTDVLPVHFAYPTPAWRVGEIVTDVYTLYPAATIIKGHYTPLLIWYDPAQAGAEVGRVTLESVWVE